MNPDAADKPSDRPATGADDQSPAGAPAMTPAETFEPTLGDIDLHLFGEGTHLSIHDKLGAHCRTIDGVDGVSFAVWAPSAPQVWVTGDMNGWDESSLPLRELADSGVFERFVPGAHGGQKYKFVIGTADGKRLLKSDPYGRYSEQPPGNASVVVPPSAHHWRDTSWLARRARVDSTRAPMSIYEVHLGSWLRSPDGPLTYRQAAETMVERIADLGFTHVELLPVMEHPFGGSWGYQVTGFFAPTSRWGTPDGLRALIDAFHRHGISVILDWVPAHFPRDDHALYRFDGTGVYEHIDARKGHHPDWDTAIFNYGRRQVVNFLLASALHWLRDYHIDGLRVDAVASMLYLDYSRDEGQWEPNRHGGRENLEAIEFLKQLTTVVRSEHPDVLLFAEESTAWPGVTKPVEHGGLGFHHKWNLGWMHDTLEYFGTDPLFRGGVHDKLTFGMMYEHTEHFLAPLSHDEVVHGKGSLLAKLPGDSWQRFANLRALLAYQWMRPGKQLVFMGTELGTWREWDHDGCLEWHLADEPDRAGLLAYVGELNRVYAAHECLWRGDPDESGFQWLECEDKSRSVFAFVRRWNTKHLVIILNLTPVPQQAYRLGVPAARSYTRLLASDDERFGGTGWGDSSALLADGPASHGCAQSLALDLPALSATVLAPAG